MFKEKNNLEFKIGENKVLFNNSILGTETVFLNDEKVSSKMSILGKRHYFKINNEEYILKVNASLLFPKAKISLFKKENTKEDSIETSSSKITLIEQKDYRMSWNIILIQLLVVSISTFLITYYILNYIY